MSFSTYTKVVVKVVDVGAGCSEVANKKWLYQMRSVGFIVIVAEVIQVFAEKILQS